MKKNRILTLISDYKQNDIILKTTSDKNLLKNYGIDVWYKLAEDEGWSTEKKVIITIINSIVTQQRGVFCLSRRSLAYLVQTDINWKKDCQPSVNTRNYSNIRRVMFELGFFEIILNSYDKKINVFAVKDSEIKKWLKIDFLKQQEEAISFRNQDFKYHKDSQCDQKCDHTCDQKCDVDIDTVCGVQKSHTSCFLNTNIIENNIEDNLIKFLIAKNDIERITKTKIPPVIQNPILFNNQIQQQFFDIRQKAIKTSLQGFVSDLYNPSDRTVENITEDRLDVIKTYGDYIQMDLYLNEVNKRFSIKDSNHKFKVLRERYIKKITETYNKNLLSFKNNFNNIKRQIKTDSDESVRQPSKH